jgi:hypothetical protein
MEEYPYSVGMGWRMEEYLLLPGIESVLQACNQSPADFLFRLGDGGKVFPFTLKYHKKNEVSIYVLDAMPK